MRNWVARLLPLDDRLDETLVSTPSFVGVFLTAKQHVVKVTVWSLNSQGKSPYTSGLNSSRDVSEVGPRCLNTHCAVLLQVGADGGQIKRISVE
jgi:hypothetical protein